MNKIGICFVAAVTILMVGIVGASRREGTDASCQSDPEPGPCKASHPRWYYNHARGECQPFTWGGCRGNANRFGTRAQCENRCRSPAVDALDVTGCSRRCRKPCAHGYVVDSQGCPIRRCVCNPNPNVRCPALDCIDSQCPNGYQTDINGCQTCDCRILF